MQTSLTLDVTFDKRRLLSMSRVKRQLSNVKRICQTTGEFMKVASVLAIAVLVTATIAAQEKPRVPATLNFTMDSLAGKPVNLARYQGNVVLIVNVCLLYTSPSPRDS